MMMVVILKLNIDGLEEVYHERSFDLPDKETLRVTHANAASYFWSWKIISMRRAARACGIAKKR